MNIISNCPLCEAKALHVMGEGELRIQQCINCGYVTTEKFNMSEFKNKGNHPEYQKLPKNMQNWSMVSSNYIWTPTIMTLPIGMLYSENVDDVMVWKFARMVDITEEERSNYPIPNQEGKFYKKTYDIANAKIYEVFVDAMHDINKEFKEKNKFSKEADFNLPKLKKV